MNGQTVSQAYCLGIREGRATLRQFAADGIANMETLQSHLANCRAATGLSGDAADFARGERDFFRNQIAKLKGES